MTLKYNVMNSLEIVFKNEKSSLGLLTLVLMLFLSNATLAQSYYYTHSSGDTVLTFESVGTSNKFKVNNSTTEYDNIRNITINEGTLTLIFNNTNPIYFQQGLSNNALFLVKKGTLNMKLGDDIEGNNATLLKRTTNGNVMFLNVDGDTNEGCNVYISGNSKRNFIIDGGVTHTLEGIGTNSPIVRANPYIKNTYPLVRVKRNRNKSGDNGIIQFNKVSLVNTWSANAAGAIEIRCEYKDISGCAVSMQMDSCQIVNCSGKENGAIRLMWSDSTVKNARITLNDCIIDSCYAGNGNGSSSDTTRLIGSNGVIRSLADNYCNLTMNNCIISNNWGCGLRWHSALTAPLILNQCSFINNWSKEDGGAIHLVSEATLTGVKLKNNTAIGSGGGIYFSTFVDIRGKYKHMPGWLPKNGLLSLDENSEVLGNKANNGGGIAIDVRRLDYIPLEGGDPQTITTNDNGEPYKIIFNQNGAIIANNIAANDGGGVYLNRNSNASFYGLECYMSKGVIDSNIAIGNGGGMCIYQDSVKDLGGLTIQPINISVATSTDEFSITKNNAKNGGGLFIKTPDSVTPTIDIYKGYIIENQSENNGAGIYVENGELFVKGGDTEASISKNVTQNGAGGGIFLGIGTISIENTSIAYNESKSTTKNEDEGCGAGVYLYDGTITIKNSDIHHNVADINGGGIYTKEGFINISGGSINENIASNGNGGGVCGIGGTVEISSTTSLNANIAEEGNGGGIYAEGKVKMLNGNITNNRAKNGGGLYMTGIKDSEITGGTISGNKALNDGGGIFSNVDTTNLEHIKILDNIADSNGGGVYILKGKIAKVGAGTEIDNNKGKTSAFSNTSLGSNNLYVEKANSIILSSKIGNVRIGVYCNLLAGVEAKTTENGQDYLLPIDVMGMREDDYFAICEDGRYIEVYSDTADDGSSHFIGTRINFFNDLSKDIQMQNPDDTLISLSYGNYGRDNYIWGVFTANAPDDKYKDYLIPSASPIAKQNARKDAAKPGFMRWAGWVSLPIELLSFHAVCNNGILTFTWETATETNNEFFTIEKSNDALTFEPIAQIQGSGTSSQKRFYSYQLDGSEGVTYYRLKQTDFDGKTSTFRTIAVQCVDFMQTPSFDIYPQPAKEQFIISTNGYTIKNISMCNMLGQQVKNQEVNSSNITLNVSNLPKGIYNLIIKMSDNTTYYKKIVVAQ